MSDEMKNREDGSAVKEEATAKEAAPEAAAPIKDEIPADVAVPKTPETTAPDMTAPVTAAPVTTAPVTRGPEQRGPEQRMPRFRRKGCRFCQNKEIVIDYKTTDVLGRFITDRGKILPRRITGTCAKHQRALSRAIKRARIVALLPFVEQ